MKQRFISAIIMAIIFIPLLIIGKLPFNIFIALLGMGAIYELLKLKPNLPLIIKLFTYLETLIVIFFNILKLTGYENALLMLMILINLSLLVFIDDKDKYNYKDAFTLIGIILFIGLSFKNFIFLRDKNLSLLIYLFLVSITTDSFALFTGKLFGKHKLAPNISPNKTIEGSLGGSLVGTIVASIFYILVIQDYTSVLSIIGLTFCLTIIGQLGDLIKSSIKRYENIKDFSNLIPGHGGILDRLDSIIFIMMTYILIMGLF